ncbi:MAG: biotin/lipoyl-containing protein [Pseudomonadota bacterium]
MSLTYAEVSEILRLVDGSDLDELILEIGETKLILRRHGAAPPARDTAPESPPERPAGAVATASPALAETIEAPEPGAVAVDSPMVGRVYFRPSPEEPPFVEEGSTVAAGDTLCLIEVMKLFTQVEAPIAGTILTRAVEDGAAVQFDQPLFWIRPA